MGDFHAFIFSDTLLVVGDDPKFFGAKSDADVAKMSFLWVCVMAIRWPLMIAFAILGLFATIILVRMG